jgi:hypothetical protein
MTSRSKSSQMKAKAKLKGKALPGKIEPHESYVIARLAQNPEGGVGNNELIGLLRSSEAKQIANQLVSAKRGGKASGTAQLILNWAKTNKL